MPGGAVSAVKPRAKLVRHDDGRTYGIRFECPGCGEPHVVPTLPEPKGWTWNGSLETPTLSPSILVRWKASDPSDPEAVAVESVCHSFVTDGRIQFLGDCTHELAGQTVDLPDWEDE